MKWGLGKNVATFQKWVWVKPIIENQKNLKSNVKYLKFCRNQGETSLIWEILVSRKDMPYFSTKLSIKDFFRSDSFWKTFTKWDPAAGYFSESNGFNDVLKVNILHKRSNFKVIKDDRVIRDEGTYLKAY